MSRVEESKAERLFWALAADLMDREPRVAHGTIMNGPCLRVDGEFLALVDYKGSGLVVKLDRARVAELIDSGFGRPFAPAGRVFRGWVSVPAPDRRRWAALLREGVALASARRVGKRENKRVGSRKTGEFLTRPR